MHSEGVFGQKLDSVYQSPAGLPRFVSVGPIAPPDVVHKFNDWTDITVYNTSGGLGWRDNSGFSLIVGELDNLRNDILFNWDSKTLDLCHRGGQIGKLLFCPGEGWKDMDFIKQFSWAKPPECAYPYLCSANIVGKQEAVDVVRGSTQHDALQKSLFGGIYQPQTTKEGGYTGRSYSQLIVNIADRVKLLIEYIQTKGKSFNQFEALSLVVDLLKSNPDCTGECQRQAAALGDVLTAINLAASSNPLSSALFAGAKVFANPERYIDPWLNKVHNWVAKCPITRSFGALLGWELPSTLRCGL